MSTITKLLRPRYTLYIGVERRGEASCPRDGMEDYCNNIIYIYIYIYVQSAPDKSES